MFINCPYCRSLVATDPATDRPPPRCPDCGGPLGAQVSNDGIDVTRTPEAAVPAGTASDATNDVTEVDPMPASHDESSNPHAFEHERTGITPDLLANETTEDAASTQEAHIDTDTSATSVVVPPSRPRIARHAPSFVRAPVAHRPRTQSRAAIATVIALSALLCLQILLADRARLAESARWRPLLEFVCGTLSCDLPPWHEPGAFTLLQRDVRQHPTVRGALRVSATFRNDARWAQPWPRLQLTLADADGRRAGERVFEAREYLGGTPEQTMLGSGETAAVAMDVLEPAPNIVAYDFRFR